MQLIYGVAYYEVLLKFNGVQIMQAFDEEMEAVRQITNAVKEKNIEQAQMQVLPMIDELLKLRIVNKSIA